EPQWLYEDDDLVVVSKPAGMITHPVERHSGDSLAEQLVERFGPLPSREDSFRPGIVHRLDRETSGVMVAARSVRALNQLQGQFRDRSVSKRYLAVVHGQPDQDRFDVDAPIGPVAGQRDLQGISTSGRDAHTEFHVLGRMGAYSVIECLPSTGRRHQLRVHLWSRGLPIVGDKLYRPKGKVQGGIGLRHHALHCAGLGFEHPVTSAPQSYVAAIPQEWTQAWPELRGIDVPT
ncbi:MAG: RluA family pseudouridine synthase, partial [Planctomycetes bacterium]|nr:RluA family pseudouridine synthase [Planctomycetota bacterium]